MCISKVSINYIYITTVNKSFWVLLICFVGVLFQTVAASLCLNGSECPHNQPFCTPVGCVFRCPSNVFINGSNCVEDCGESFIKDRTCVSECPVDYFVRQVIVSDGLQFHKHNFCEERCPKATFIFERHCLDACPENEIYLLNNTCVETCPVSQPFRRNITKYNDLVAVECQVNCRGDNPVSYGMFCLNTCHQPLFQYTNKCVDQCPKNASLIYKQGEVLHCTNICPDKEKDLNGTCLSMCPSPYKVYHKHCVSMCPKEAPYTYIDDWTEETSCVENCQYDKMYVNNTQCVSFCHLVDGNTCVDSCPASAPYFCDRNKEPFCNEPDYYDHRPNYCAKTCKRHMHVVGNACISSCPNKSKFFNHTCVRRCPTEFNYTAIMKYEWSYSYRYTFRECVSNCSSRFFHDNATCWEQCPEKKYIVKDTKMCVDKCPSSYPYVGDSKTCVSKCDPYQYPVNGKCKYGNPCEDPGSTYESDQCYCPKGYFLVFGLCRAVNIFNVLVVLLLLISITWIAFSFLIFTNCCDKVCRKSTMMVSPLYINRKQVTFKSHHVFMFSWNLRKEFSGPSDSSFTTAVSNSFLSSLEKNPKALDLG